MTGDDPRRLLRLRRGDQAAFSEGLDRLDPPGVNRQLVKVVDGGSMPVVSQSVFLAVPVSIDCDESSGATPTFVVGTEQLAVVFVGANVPSAGDLYVATAVGGRWVVDDAPTHP